MANDRDLQSIAKELKELNRKLDRLCRASIFSIGDPVLSVKLEVGPSGDDQTTETNKD